MNILLNNFFTYRVKNTLFQIHQESDSHLGCHVLYSYYIYVGSFILSIVTLNIDCMR